jgi:hypothetical protein
MVNSILNSNEREKEVMLFPLFLKMRGILLFVLLFLLVSEIGAASGTTRIFEDSVITGSYNASDGTPFSVIVNPSREIEHDEKIMVVIENRSLIVRLDNCQIAEHATVCLHNISQSDKFNITKFQFYYQADITIDRDVPSLVVSREVANPTLMPNEETFSRLKLKNNGNLVAKALMLEDKYPVNVQVVEAKGCNANANTVTWTGELGPYQEKECIVRFRGAAAGVRRVVATLKYELGGQQKTLSDQVSITVEDYAFKLSKALTKNRLTVGDKLGLNLTVEPAFEVKWNRLVLLLPEGLKVLGLPDSWNRKENILFYDKTIIAKKGFDFAFEADYIGDYSLKFELGYDKKGQKNNLSFEEGFSVNGSELLVVAHTKTIENNTGEFSVSNPSSDAFSSIVVNYTVDGEPGVVLVPEISRRSHKSIGFEYSGDKSRVPVWVSVSYSTKKGQQLETSAFYEYEVPKAEAGFKQREVTEKPDAEDEEPQEKPGLKAVVIIVPFLGLLAACMLVLKKKLSI